MPFRIEIVDEGYNPEKQGEVIQVNRWLRDPGGSGNYRIPDVMIPGEQVIFDGTVGGKSLLTPQVQDFIRFSNGAKVIIVRPFTPPQVLNP